MKFLCMAYEDEEALNALSRDEWHDLRSEVLGYVESLRSSGTLLSTHPLQSTRTASTVRVREGKLAVVDGPFAEAKEHIGGFFLIEARDMDEAVQIASKWPSARIGSIEVRPIEEGLSMDKRYR